MFAGWLEIAGTEVISTERARTYAAGLGITSVRCDACPNLPGVLGDAPYTLPQEDSAPWYDPAVPASREFAGVVGLDVNGADGTGTRTPTDLLGDGAAIGPLRRARRELTYRVALLATTDCGLSYGLGWLASALRGGDCDTGGCRGDELCAFACCPSGDGVAQLRHLYHVGLLDGPTIKTLYQIAGSGASCTTGAGKGGSHIAEAEFTLVAGIPYWYREPVTISTTGGGDVDTGGMAPGDDDCAPDVSCLFDPTCPAPAPPPSPPIPTDPCYPTGEFPTRRQVITVPAGRVPAWSEAVPIVQVNTGRGVLRRLTVRFYTNPAGDKCTSDQLDPCLACAELSIPYLPAGTLLTVDGRTRRAFVDCSGGSGPEALAEPILYGAGGGLFTWPVFSCGGAAGMCIEIVSDARYSAYDMAATVQICARDDAA